MKNTLSVLLLEDVVADAVLIGHELEKGGLSAKPKRVETREEFLNELVRNKPDVILSDHGLPSFDGFSALHEAKQRCPDVPFIFVAQASGADEIIRSYKSGAWDFVVKSEMSANLVPAIREAMAKAENRFVRRQTEPAAEQFRQLLQSSREYGILLMDEEGRILSWNEGAEKITGIKESDALGEPLSKCFRHDVAAEKLQRLITSAVENGEASEPMVELQHEGRRVLADVSINSLRDDLTSRPLLSVIIKDVTARSQSEDELRRSRDEAEYRCRQRTAELDGALKELDAFSYSVSHDLRAPLRHIDGFVEMLHQRLQSTLDDTGKEYLGIIATAAKQMGTLIDALLSFSRTSRATLFTSRVALDKVVQSVTRDLRFETEGREVEWSVGALPTVDGDPTLLRQVFFNLIGNALKFTRGRPKARIEIGAADQGSEWLIHVRDNGAGFDMQYAGKLFGVFQRLHTGTEFEGTGIGLANVRRIIQRHGGRTWAEGTPQGGATFYFSLPQIRDAEHAP